MPRTQHCGSVRGLGTADPPGSVSRQIRPGCPWRRQPPRASCRLLRMMPTCLLIGDPIVNLVWLHKMLMSETNLRMHIHLVCFKWMDDVCSGPPLCPSPDPRACFPGHHEQEGVPIIACPPRWALLAPNLDPVWNAGECIGPILGIADAERGGAFAEMRPYFDSGTIASPWRFA